jgi:hypothetical protein
VVVDDQDDGTSFVIAAPAAATRNQTAFRRESSFCQPAFRP